MFPKFSNVIEFIQKEHRVYMLFVLIFIVLLLIPSLNAINISDADLQKLIKAEEEKSEEWFQEIAKFYQFPEGEDIQEITQTLLDSPLIKDSRKKTIQESGRRTFIFNYPSDDLKVKGVISFIPNPEENSTLILLRGGNRIFGIQNPGMDLMNLGKYTVISTTYRGGVSEGVDEFGGNDVNDVKNLIEYIPELQKKLGILIQSEGMYMIGRSRGGMQLFLTLGRFPELQSRFSKVVSLSGLLDMRNTINTRADMKEMFIKDFGLIENANEEEWINHRDPVLTVDAISTNLPILIIHGTEDIRVSREEGYNMVSKLQAHGNLVTYWEVEGADHCLDNTPDCAQRIQNWLEE